NLSLTDYLSGQPALVEGMDLSFSLAVLSVWSLLSLLVAFIAFTRRDILT
ncbi:MAG: ABC transporter permease, partial [Thermoactinomyces sp.]